MNIATTDRLLIRHWQLLQDAQAAFAIYGDPEVMHFIRPPAPDVASACSYLQNHTQDKTDIWAIVEKDTQEVIGSIILAQLPDNEGKPTSDYEIGWHLRRSSWGKGYATEAARAIIAYGFDVLQLPVLYAVVKPGHERSIRVTQRLGMISMGLTHQYYGVELLLFKLFRERSF